MTELLFPAVGALLVFLVAVPCLTAVSVALLRYAPQLRGAVDASGSPVRFALIVGPTPAAVLWMGSAAHHQSEGSTPLAACIVDHLGGEICADVAFFGALLLAVLGLSAVRRAGAERARHCGQGAPAALTAARQRLLRVCRRAPALRKWQQRIHVVQTGVAPACTRGLLLPHVELELDTVETLSEDELLAVALHEVQHAEAQDPLRLFVAHAALSLNPLRSLLAGRAPSIRLRAGGPVRSRGGSEWRRAARACPKHRCRCRSPPGSRHRSWSGRRWFRNRPPQPPALRGRAGGIIPGAGLALR